MSSWTVAVVAGVAAPEVAVAVAAGFVAAAAIRLAIAGAGRPVQQRYQTGASIYGPLASSEIASCGDSEM